MSGSPLRATQARLMHIWLPRQHHLDQQVTPSTSEPPTEQVEQSLYQWTQREPSDKQPDLTTSASTPTLPSVPESPSLSCPWASTSLPMIIKYRPCICRVEGTLSPGMSTVASTMAATSRYGLKDRAWQQVRHLLRSTIPSAVTQIQPSASSMMTSWPEEVCACSVIKKNRRSVQAATAVSPAKRACLRMEELAQSLTLLLAAQTPITAST